MVCYLQRVCICLGRHSPVDCGTGAWYSPCPTCIVRRRPAHKIKKIYIYSLNETLICTWHGNVFSIGIDLIEFFL